MRRASVLLVTVALAVVPGCAPPPTPPVIEHVELPASVTADPTSGEYVVAVQVTFHDDDDAVTGLRIGLPTIAMDEAQPLVPSLLSGTVSLTVRFPPRTPKGATEIDLSLVDRSGLVSAVANESVTLQ